MCTANVAPEAEQAFADLVLDMAKALDPEHPERVVIGPVDFGANAAPNSRPLRPAPLTPTATHSDETEQHAPP